MKWEYLGNKALIRGQERHQKYRLVAYPYTICICFWKIVRGAALRPLHPTTSSFFLAPTQ